MDSNVDSLLVDLASWVQGLRYESLPQQVLHHVRRSLLDHLGVTVRGSTSRLARKLRTYLWSSEGNGGASVLGTQLKLSASDATFANGAAASVLELDDGHALAAIHIGATCIPAILSTAQLQRASERDIIVAAAAAYEASARLAMASTRASVRGFNATPLIGVFGAAIGTAKILGSDAHTIANALGMAGSNTGGLFDYHGGWLDTWSINVGRTGRAGVVCANLAEAGVSGPLDIFHGPRGFAAAFTDGSLDGNQVMHAIGQEWYMLQTYIKPYPCCRRLHSVIDAVLAMRSKVGASLDAIDHIFVETSAESARLDSKTFDTVSAAQMSIPYGVAAALVFGPPQLDHFDEAARQHPQIRKIVDRIDVREAVDPAVSGRLAAARVTVSAGGYTTSEIVNEPLGNPNNPVDDQALENKFRELVEPVIGGEATARVVETIWSFGETHGRLEESDGLRFLESLCTEAEGTVAKIG